MSTITPAVAQAIDQIRATFPDCTIDVAPDNAGGAYVVVNGLRLGPPYVQPEIWIGFQITFQYPYADVYPHFAPPDLARADGRALGEGMGNGSFRGAPAIQISRRSTRLNPARDTAALKLLKVIQWLRSRP